MRLIYPVDVTEHGGPPDEAGFTVAFPDLPEAVTWGDTLDEALVNATDCLEEALAARILAREVLPVPSAARGRPTIAPGSLIGAKVALYLALRDADITPAELARRLGTQPSGVTRLLDPAHASKPARIDDALTALGKRLVVALEPAA